MIGSRLPCKVDKKKQLTPLVVYYVKYIYTLPKENRYCFSNFTDEVSRFIIME